MNKKEIRDNLILAIIIFLVMIGVSKAALKGGIAYDVHADATATDATETIDNTSVTPEGGETTDTSTSDSTDDSTDSTDTNSNTMSAAEIAALTQELSDTQKEKNELKSTLNQMLSSQNDFISKLNELDDMILEYQDKLDEISQKTSEAQSMMAQLSGDIEEAQANQDAQYELLKSHIREEYENGTYSFMDALFNSENYVDAVSNAEYVQAIESYDEKLLSDYTKAKLVLADKNLLLTTLTSNMDVLSEAYQNKQDSLQVLSDEKEAQINSYQASIDTMNSKVKTLEDLEAEVQAKISAAETSFSASYSTSGSTGSGVYNGAQFLWPVPTSSVITSYYGPRTAPTAGATTDHKGIDISCNEGSEVIAVADGTVIYVGYIGSGGNTVVLDHGSGIATVYHHLSTYNCAVGDTVKAGQTICYSGNTGVSTGPHLHFAVRENGNYVNPLKYYSMIQDKSNESSTEGD